MAINLELLNQSSDEITIIIGDNILLKMQAGILPTTIDPRLKQVVNIKDLQKSVALSQFKKLQRLTKNIKDSLGKYVNEFEQMERFSTDATITTQIRDKLTKFLTDELSKCKAQIINASSDIEKTEREVGIRLSDSYKLGFCKKCHAYMGEMSSLITQCPKCSEPITEESKVDVTYLDKTAYSFLDGGIWFEEYVRRLLEEQDWKVWTHVSVMGSSGILHPIDVLAIKNGRVLIAECKTGAIDARDISHFMTQKSDIPSHFGLFMSVMNCSSKNNANLLKVSTSCLIHEIGNKTDTEITKEISRHVKKFK